MSINPLKLDPTRTALLRRQFVAQMEQKFDRLRRQVWQLVFVDNSFDLHSALTDKDRQLFGKPTTNAPNFKFLTDPNKLAAFRKWLQDMVNQGILEISTEGGEPPGLKPWLYKYIDSAYKKGTLSAYVATRPELQQKQPFYEGSKAEFLQSAFGRPERVSKLQLLHTRAFENLRGVTTQMATQMNRVMADSMAHGKGALETGRALSKAVSGLPKARAKMIARTEIIHAHAEGQLDGMEDLGVEQVKADVEWSTAGDSGVCPKCKAMEGKLFTLAQAHGLIPLHPNCRCSWTPHIVVPKLKLKPARPRPKVTI